MNKHRLFLIRVSVVSVLCLLLSLGASVILEPKFYNDKAIATTVTFRSFYAMQKDTVDVLFAGSSHAVCGYSPQYLYDHFGIRSFNLGSDEQNMIITYYWLKEALKYQKPSAVVLDTVICFDLDIAENNINEPSVRKAIDPMRLSLNKINAVNDFVRINPAESKLSYYIPALRFHERWKNLEYYDLHFFEKQSYDMKGYSLLTNKTEPFEYHPFTVETDEQSTMVPLMKEYLNRITKLCSDHGIKLILVKTPCYQASYAKYNTLRQYADENGLDYYDYNLKELYDLINFDFSEDMSDPGHANVYGAEKLTEHIGQILSGTVPAVEDSQWILSRDYYCQKKEQKPQTDN